MEKNFDAIFDFVMKEEGFTSNHPSDPGGKTIWGISSRYFPSVVAELKSLPPDIAKERAKNFYYNTFWKKLGCNTLPTGMDAVIFDTAVNMGPDDAVICLKRKTWESAIAQRLRQHCKKTKTVFLRGIIGNRIADLIDFCCDLVKKEEEN